MVALISLIASGVYFFVQPGKTGNVGTLEEIVNRYRNNEGLTALVRDETLCVYAQQRLIQIKNQWSHQGFYQISDEMYKQTKLKHIGENLSISILDEEDILEKWLESPDHKYNLDLNIYSTHCLVTDGTNVVHLFGGY